MSYKILSLDGGGTWALLEVMALQDMFPGETGLQILSHFDLAVANSGGSIILAGLALDMQVSQIRSFFEDEEKRKSIFYRKPLLEEDLCVFTIFPKYETAQKIVGLRGVMGSGGDKFLSQLPLTPNWPVGPSGMPVGLLIMAFDYDRLREDFLRSYAIPESGAEPDDIALANAVHASTNAPVAYFDKPAQVGSKRYWDGAMGGYNNPLMAAIVDAVSLGVNANDIKVLSFGTGTVRLVPSDLSSNGTPAELMDATVKPGVIGDAGRAGGCITDDPPDSASYTAHIMLGGSPKENGPVVRLSPLAQPVHSKPGAWDYPKELPKDLFLQLKALGMDAVESADVDAIVKLGTVWIHGSLQNQPVRMRTDLTCAVGEATYSAGKKRWFEISP